MFVNAQTEIWRVVYEIITQHEYLQQPKINRNFVIGFISVFFVKFMRNNDEMSISLRGFIEILILHFIMQKGRYFLLFNLCGKKYDFHRKKIVKEVWSFIILPFIV